MRRVLSTVLAIALLLGLGALAVMALPNGSAPTTASALAAAPLAAEPDAPAAPTATENYNLIAMPLNSQNQFTAAGLTWDAEGLANLVGTGVSQVLQWNSTNQAFETWYPQFDLGTNFQLAVGSTYFMLVDSTVGTVVSFVGDVPAQNSLQHNLLGGSPCRYNAFMVPLDQSSITDATGLGLALVNAEQVLAWDAGTQTWQTWYPEFGLGQNFSVQIGYPYFACMKANTTWP